MSLVKTPSPSEKVHLYLDEQLQRHSKEPSVRLPPVRQIAAYLKVSTATVHHVYKELIREGKLRTGVGRGTLLINPALDDQAQENRRLCIAITARTNPGETNETTAWGHTVIEALFKALARQSRRITLLPLGDSTMEAEEVVQQIIRERDHVDGLIFGFQHRLLPYKDQLVETYEAAGKPVVSIHAQDLFYLSYNSVLTDFFRDSRSLGRALYRAGRRRMVCLCVKGLDFAISNQQRFFGMQLGVSTAGGGGKDLPAYWSTGESRMMDSYEVVKRALSRSRKAPDAIFCAGDYLALGAIRALEEAGLSVPEDVSVIGSTGVNLDGTIRPGMTRMLQCFDEIANRLVAVMLRRIDRKEALVPGEYPPVRWHFGDTTTEEENRLIREALP